MDVFTYFMAAGVTLVSVLIGYAIGRDKADN